MKSKKINKARFWVRPQLNFKWCDDYTGGNMLSEKWKENFRMYSIYFSLRFTLFIEKQTRLLKTYISGKANRCYVISFGWRKNAKKAFGRFWQNDHLQSCASNLSSYFQICRRNLFEINRQAWTFFLPREMMETNFRFC